ncbi:MAG: helix-turn-helix domain-containing protein [Candidatus Eremiobacteraeota bacterium]|nr:helix-turn-helix domain-containing protein [Candidatus Eremiobacteraeota bacterium]
MLGSRLRFSRERLGHSRRDLSELSGIDQTTIYKIETEKIKNPNLSTIEHLAQALDVDVFYLLGATDDPSKKKAGHTSIKVEKPLKVQQLKEVLHDFKEVSARLKKARIDHAMKERPYYPILLDVPLDGGEVDLSDISEEHIRGHINMVYHEKVDYIFEVKGNAMEPFVGDGALVMVRAFEPGMVKDDDVAVFHLKEKKITTIRQAFFHRVQQKLNVGLRSFNPPGTDWYHFVPEIITCEGKVIGTETEKKAIKALIENLEPRSPHHK